MIGQIVGSYRVLRELGSGGMGTVYEGVHVQIGRRAAIKVLNKEFSRNPEIASRFLNEARAVNIVQHPGLVAIFEFGQLPDGAAYIIMEYLGGELLTARLARVGGRLPVPDALRVGRQIASALGAAHAKGIIHRDMKPDNVMIVPDPEAPGGERAKIMDFGIAKVAQQASESANSGLTQTGQMLGTPQYMAPEQARGLPVNDRVDVYSFGILLYQMLVGRPPFVSPGLGELVTMHVFDEPPPIRQMAPSVPDALAVLVHSMLLKDPAHRPAMQQVALRLGELEAGIAGGARGPIAAGRQHAATVLGAMAPPRHGVADRGPTTMRPTARPPSGASRAVLIGAGVLGILLAAGGGAFFALRQRGAGAGSGEVLLRLHGSSTLGGELVPALVEGYLKQGGGSEVRRVRDDGGRVRVSAKLGGRDVAVEIEAKGSAQAFADLATGACDVGMASRPVHDEEARLLVEKGVGDMRSAAAEHVVALDGIAVAVNPKNTVTALDMSKLADIFSGAITDWKDVGGEPGPIHIHVMAQKHATAEVFKETVLGDRALGGDVAPPYDDPSRLVDAVLRDPGAIGVVAIALVKGARALAVSDGTSMPVYPTRFTIMREDYLLSRRLYLYTPEPARSSVASELVRFALSSDGQKIVSKLGFVDLGVETQPAAGRCTGCPADYVAATRGAEQLSVTFRFDRASERIDTRGLEDLKRMETFVADNRARKLLLLGFSDNPGGGERNRRLSRERAMVVAREFVAHGFPQPDVYGFGTAMPVASSKTEQGKARNNRVEVWVR